MTEDVGEFEKGYVVGERFKILALLGKGGMGFVYLVKDRQSGHNYAMKTVSAMNTSERIVQRFELEAKATSLISHPNVIQFHDFGLIDGRQPYFVMDYCEGDTLADLIKCEGSLSVERMLDIFIPICSAVAYAHTQSVVHRDLKPSNIMVKRIPGGALQVKVLDFGIAKVLLDETAFNSLTRTGELFGSPYYMSPEQCVGKAIDTRSDIYSLGCVLFEALTGSPPYMSDNPLTTMMKHQTATIPTLKEGTLGREFPADLEKIVSKMLAKNPDERYENLLLVEHDLRLLKRGERLELKQQPLQKTGSSSFPFGLIALGAISLLLAGGATSLMLQANFSEKPKPLAPVSTAQPFETPFPDLKDMSKVNRTVTTKFYSDDADIHAKRRRFHFPAKSIGKVGKGDLQESFIPAIGEMVRDVPLTFETGRIVGELSGFRPDEIEFLIMRGPLVDNFATGQFRNWQVRSLNMEWSDVDDRAIENIRTLSKLNSLNVSSTHLSASGLSKLRLENFTFLEASQIAYLMPVLTQLKNCQLTVLHVRDAGVTDADLKNIFRLQKLEVLDLTSNEITDKGIAYLIPLKHLSELWIGENKITPKCIDSLKKFSNLSGVTMSMTGWTEQEKANFLRAAKQAHFSVSVMQNHLSKAENQASKP